jgi:hypothetical protein
MATKTEVAAAANQLPDIAGGFEQYAGAGLENVGVKDLLVPRLSILQALSPQLKPRDSAYIEGAKVGMIADVGTGELFPDGVLFLPVHYRKDWLEWAPRASGKGLVATHSDPSILDQTTRDDKNRPILPNGNYIAETAQFFGINLSAGRRKCFIPMASTQLKKARKWNTLATGERLKRSNGTEYAAPLFYRAYKLGTADESNAEGDWAGWTIDRDKSMPELEELFGTPWTNVLDEVIQFREALIQGEIKADVAGMDGSTIDGEVVDQGGAM